MTDAEILALASATLTNQIYGPESSGVLDFARRVMAESAKGAEPVAWMWEQAQYYEGDLRGRCWNYRQFGTQKPDAPSMQRNVIPLYAFPPDAAAEVDRLKADLRSCKTNAYEMFMECGTAYQRAKRAEAELAALRNAATPPDMVLEVTTAMENAGMDKAAFYFAHRVTRTSVAEIFKAMLAASEGEHK
jgi:hypothetical protein